MRDEEITFDLSAMSRTELEAEIVNMAKLIDRIRPTLAGVTLDIKDEGDRCYFGSSNDADDLKALESDMLDTLNELEMPWMQGRDLYADLRALREENSELKARIASLLAQGIEASGGDGTAPSRSDESPVAESDAP